MFSPSFIFHFFSEAQNKLPSFLIFSFCVHFSKSIHFHFHAFWGTSFLIHFFSVPPYPPVFTRTSVHKQIVRPFLRPGSFLWCKKVRAGSLLVITFVWLGQVKNHCSSSWFTDGLCSSSLHWVPIPLWRILIFKQYVVLAENTLLKKTSLSLPRVSSFVNVFETSSSWPFFHIFTSTSNGESTSFKTFTSSSLKNVKESENSPPSVNKGTKIVGFLSLKPTGFNDVSLSTLRS